ncbi:MAG: ATP-binding protein [Victivallaceae bacterium]
MIIRTLESYAKQMAKVYPVVTITGPRQSGKTTLVKSAFNQLPYVNLEHPVTRDFAKNDPVAFLEQYPDGAVLDEIQRVPELLSYIQVRVDENNRNGEFILTGSHQLELREGINQSLAGRTAIIKLLPFSLQEISVYGNSMSADELICKGFYPRIYDKNIPPHQAYSDYFETYIERDLRNIENIRNLDAFRLFIKLCAGRVGQLLNLSNLSNEAGVSIPTIKEWFSILQASYILFTLPPYHPGNLNKRLVKSSKLYFYDVGLASWLCGIEELRHLYNHPLRGNLFENMIIADVLKWRWNHGKSNNLSFYRDSNGNEVDLIYEIAGTPMPVEIKSGKTISNDYLKGLWNFAKEIKIKSGSILLYAGDIEQDRSDIKIINYRRFTDILETLG